MEYIPPPNSGKLDPNHQLFLEIIRQGVALEKNALPITKEYLTIGRLPTCNIPLEHPSVSRNHAVLQFSPPNIVSLYDLGSAHGTKVNKQVIPRQEYVVLHHNDQIVFGESSRVFVFVDETKKDLEPVLIKKPVAKQVDRIHEVTWGFKEDAEVEDDDVKLDPPPNAPYLLDPRKWLTNWLQAHGLNDLDFDQEDAVVDGQKVQVLDTIVHVSTRRGTVSITGRGRHHKRKEAEKDAAMMILIKLDKRGLLREGQVLHAKKRVMPEEDELDDGVDDMYDETKPKKKKTEQAVETFDTLQEKLRLVTVEMVQCRQEVEKLESTSTTTEEDEDDIDAVMNQMVKAEGIQRIKKLKGRLVELEKEQERLNKLIKLTTPADYVAKPIVTKEEVKQVQAPIIKNSSPPPPRVIHRPPPSKRLEEELEDGPESTEQESTEQSIEPKEAPRKKTPEPEVDFTKVKEWQDDEIEDATGNQQSTQDLNKLYGF